MIKIQLVNLPQIVCNFTYNQLKDMANNWVFKYWNKSKDFRIVGIIKGEVENDKN